MMDAEDEGKTCTPWDVKYNSATGLGLLANDGDNSSLEQALRSQCKKVNKKSNCAARACMVENYFVVRTMRLFLHGIKSEKECCGSYPLRYPYKHLNGDRGCCGEKTYNTQMMMCCDDGSVKVVC